MIALYFNKDVEDRAPLPPQLHLLPIVDAFGLVISQGDRLRTMQQI